MWGAAVVGGASIQLVEAPALGVGAGCSGYAPPAAASFSTGIGGIRPLGPIAQKRSRVEFFTHEAADAVVLDSKSTDTHAAAALYSIAISECEASVAVAFDAPAVDAIYNAVLQCAQEVGLAIDLESAAFGRNALRARHIRAVKARSGKAAAGAAAERAAAAVTGGSGSGGHRARASAWRSRRTDDPVRRGSADHEVAGAGPI